MVAGFIVFQLIRAHQDNLMISKQKNMNEQTFMIYSLEALTKTNLMVVREMKRHWQVKQCNK